MKQMTCAEMGGPATCTTLISGNTPDEMVANGMTHLESTHPDMAASVKNAKPDDPMMVKWNEDFKKKWDAAPEM